MQILVKDIVVKKRVRKDMGDIEALAESFKKFGQISPIVISRKKVLIAGGRRLEAAKYLGWKTINAVVADINGTLGSLEYEVEENLQRREFNPDELAEAARKIHRLRNPGFLKRIWNRIVLFFRRLFRIEN
ncbi:MAG: ParB N-terminal domain-containing protein [Treponema sp.]|nr:ParB N-terminal domain-containing protein [Treponema sp.]